MAERRVSFIIGANIRNFQKGMENASKSMKRLGRNVERTGKNLSRNLTAPLAALGAGLVALQKQTGNYADELMDLSEISGISTDALQEWRNVARIAGVETDALSNAASGLSRRMRGIGEESGAAHEAAEKLGVNFKTASGEIRDTDSIMSDTIARLAEMEPGLERASMAGDLFGRRWEQIAPILGMTAREIDHARQQAHDLGMVMDGEALNAANNFRIKFEELQERVKSSGRELAVSFMPIVQNELIPMLETGMNRLQGLADRFRALDIESQKNALTMAAVAAAAGPVLIIFGKLARTIGLLLSPIALKIGLIAALAAGFTYVVKNADAFQDHIRHIMNKALIYVGDGVSGMLRRLAEFAAWTGQTELAMGLFQMTAGIQEKLNDINTDKPTTEFQNFGEFFDSVRGNIGDGLQWLTDRFFQFGNSVEEALDIGGGLNIQRNASLDLSITPPDVRGIEGEFNALDRLYDRLQKKHDQTSQSAELMGQALQSTVSSAVTSFAETLGNAFTGDAGASGFFNNILIVVADFGKQLGRMLVAAGIAAQSFQKLLLNPIGAIVAGGALIAASTAVSNLLKEGPGGGGSEARVNDAIIRSDGSIVHLNANDDVLAMQDFGGLQKNRDQESKNRVTSGFMPMQGDGLAAASAALAKAVVSIETSFGNKIGQMQEFVSGSSDRSARSGNERHVFDRNTNDDILSRTDFRNLVPSQNMQPAMASGGSGEQYANVNVYLDSVQVWRGQERLRRRRDT